MLKPSENGFQTASDGKAVLLFLQAGREGCAGVRADVPAALALIRPPANQAHSCSQLRGLRNSSNRASGEPVSGR